MGWGSLERLFRSNYMNVQFEYIVQARLSYEDFLREFELTEEAVYTASSNQADLAALPEWIDTILVAQSPISGRGLFACKDFSVGEYLGPARYQDGKRTAIGRFTNHGSVEQTNVMFVPTDGGSIQALVIQPVTNGQEFLVHYPQAMDVNGWGHLLRQVPQQIFTSPMQQITQMYPHIQMEHYSDRQKVDIVHWILDKHFDNTLDTLPLTNNFIGNLYLRELTIPAGYAVVGKLHTKEHLSICTQGDITVLTDNGMLRVGAGFTEHTPAGLKRLGYAHSETKWLTVHDIGGICKSQELSLIESLLFRDSDISWVDKIMLPEMAQECIE